MQKRYRIAIYTRTYPPKGGGIAAAHFNLAQCLRRQHHVAIFAFDDDDAREESNVFRAKTPTWLARIMRWLARRWVSRYAKGEQATNCERIACVAPAVWSLNRALRSFQPDFILCPDNFVPALALRKPDSAKLIWVAHHNYRRFEGNPIASQYSWIDLQLAHRLERRAMKKVDAIVAVSDYMEEVTRNSLEPSQPMFVCRNYLDAESISKVQPSNLRVKLNIQTSTPIVHIPSAGSAVKGERYVYELVRRLGRDGSAAFFLSGNLSPMLHKELEYVGQETRIYAPGAQNYAGNLNDLAACDLTVSPALIENLSSAHIESLALGVPVVTFDVGGNKEIVQPGRNGYLASYLDIERLISLAQGLLTDRSALTALKHAAPLSISEILSSDRVLNDYAAVFKAIGVSE